ncbi:MAG: iron-containing alcohol dehydrogenase [Thermomicrobia bacterium]|nr:iron-containing alcohol dehydrogenase [Thermomicrobia bacterium]
MMDLTRQYVFHAPTRVIFGGGSIQTTGREMAAIGGTAALVVTDRGVVSAGLLDGVLASLAAADVATTLFDAVEPNPSIGTVGAALKAYQSGGCNALIAVGGGSPMDVAKAVGILATNGGAISDYEGKPDAVREALPPFVCVPTTCGTGSEVTPFAVITDQERHWKMSIASPREIPRVAIIDPDLFVKMPASLIAATGMDALTHAIESYTNQDVQPFSDALDIHAIRLIGMYLRPAVANGNREAMAQMAVAATMAGMGFSQNRLGIVHAISHPVTSYVGTPHGVANAILLPYVMEFNAIGAGSRIAEVGKALTDNNPQMMWNTSPQMGIQAVRALSRDVGIPETLAEVGVMEEHVTAIAADAMKSGNIRINPRRVTIQEIERVIRNAINGVRADQRPKN